MKKVDWHYEKLDENGKLKHCPMNDYDGSITGHIVFGVKAWFDENPEERKRLGWIKHITPDTRDIEYDKQTQILVRSTRQLDEWTLEDVYHPINKSEEMMLLEEIGSGAAYGAGVVFVGDWGDMEWA